MASTSSMQKSFKYDVFLSFRGEDTRNSFVGHLYQALKQKGIQTYMDDKKIEQGKTIKDQLINSIEDSRFYIIVFSKTYASSSWCLDELVKIMECQKTAEHTAYPVFFDVEPTQVGKQSGPVKEAFAEHEKKEAAGKWREAMKEASGLAGWELKKIVSGDESKLIQVIVDNIFRKLCSINLSIDGNLVGMEIRKKEVLSSLDIGTNDVRVIGIKGIGGGGKTTLAKAVYDQISTHFEGTSFVENVREVSKTCVSGGLKTLQEQILKDVFDDKDISIRGGVYNGKDMMRKMMPRKKVLVVLDDVDDREQLEALVDNFESFKPGSRIIITTRDEQVLLSFGVCLICNVNLLTDEEAVCLFRRYAFGKEIPNQWFNEMSGHVVRYAAGLPLTIKVLGSLLCGNREWKDALDRLKKVPEQKTVEILKISYDALENDYKEIFLDVACILKGEQKDKAIRVLESCGFYGRNGLSVLEHKCLINISQSGSLGMHDLIEEMGKHIVRQSDPNDPNRDSRLWIEEKIDQDRLDNDLVNERIKCIKLSHLELEFDTVMRGLRNKRKLRVLYMCSGANWNDSEVRQCFPDSLQYLSWRSYPFLTLHETFQADNLVGLDMSFSSIELFWECGKRKVLNKLRFLDLSYSNLKILNLKVTPKLEILNLEHCANEELYIAHGCPKLQYLNLDCSNLRKLILGPNPGLETLSLGRCSSLLQLHLHRCPKLKVLKLDGSKLSTLDLSLTPNLERLDLKDCSKLEKIDAPDGCLEKLVYLDLSGCGRFKSFLFDKQSKPLKVGSLSELHLIGESIDICPLHPHNSFPKFQFTCFYKEDPAASSFGDLKKLISIGLCSCTNLQSFSRSIYSLQCLEKLTLEGSIPKVFEVQNLLEGFPVSIYELKHLRYVHLLNRTLDNLPPELADLNLFRLGNTLYFKMLKLEDCNDLVDLHLQAESLNLEYPKFSYSKLKTSQLGSTPNLEELILEGCYDLVELQMPEESLKLKYLELCRSRFYHSRLRRAKLKIIQLRNTPNLKELILKGCNDRYLELCHSRPRRSKLKTIQLRNTLNLEELILEGCTDLVDLQMPEESLKLKYLELSHSKLKTIQLGNTPYLKMLILEGCTDLVEFQMPAESLNLRRLNLSYSKLKTIRLGNTPNLEELILEGCTDLVEFQMPAENLNLEYIKLSHSKLKTFQLGNTPNLEKLILEGCNDMVEFQMLAESLNLEYLNLSHSKLKNIQLGDIPNLKTLILEGCTHLVEFEMPAESLNLEYLNLSRSTLKNIQLGNIPNLKTLILEGCTDLAEFQMPDKCLNFEYLNLSHSTLKTIQLGNAPYLKKLILESCNDLVEFQMPAENLNLQHLNLSYSKLKNIQLGNTPNLEELILEGCTDLVEFQMPAESLNLRYLDLSHSKLKTFQLGNTPNLEDLILEGCDDLEELRMPLESRGLLGINLSHSKLRTLDLGRTPKLRWLNLENCSDLIEINAPSGLLFPVDLLALSGCGRFKNFRFDKELNHHLKKQLDSLSELHLIAETVDVCQLHPDNSFPKFRFECYYDEAPASLFRNLEMLISMGLCACTNLEKFSRSICSLRGLRKLTFEGSIPEVPRDLDQLECLEELIFSSSNIRNLPDSFCKLKHLKSLELKSCLLLEKLPDDLGRIESLETLTIMDCSCLQNVPKNIGKINVFYHQTEKVYKRYTHGKLQPK